MNVVRVLIGIALFVLVCLCYRYTGSRIIFVGFMLAYLCAVFALVVSAFPNGRDIVVGSIKWCIWFTLGTIVLFMCHLSGWNYYILLACGVPFVVISIVIVLYKGNAIREEEEKAEREQNVQKIVDAINNLSDVQKENIKKTISDGADDEE